VTSRRAAEEMIIAGRVAVNGKVVNALPCFIDPESDEISVDGQSVKGRQRQRAYFLLNKPRGAVCTMRDPQNRPRAVDMVPSINDRVYCVGGLDDEATGLVIVTNDGQLTKHLTDPRLGLEMTYVIECDGKPNEQAVITLKSGVFIDGRRTPRSSLKFLRAGGHSLIEMHTSEGRNAVLRRVFHRVGHKIRRLKRTAIVPIGERGLKIGHYRPLSPQEVRRLQNLGKDGGDTTTRRQGDMERRR